MNRKSVKKKVTNQILSMMRNLKIPIAVGKIII